MESKKPLTKKAKPKKDPKEIERKLKGEQEVFHDLFRLDTSSTKKNVGWNENEIWEQLPHKHFFHTYDSSGRKSEKSSPSCGHFHPVEVEYSDDGEIIGVTCGEPMVMDKGRAYPYKNDNHTHEVEYLGSEKIKVRTMSREAVKVISQKQKEENQFMHNPLA
jgi:hypothetical protein